MRTPQGELDLVLERGSAWLCVEVKSGRWRGPQARHRPASHYTRRQSERQERAARALASQLGRPLPERWLVELLFEASGRCAYEVWTRADELHRGSRRGGASGKNRP